MDSTAPPPPSSVGGYLQLLFGLRHPISRRVYLAAGVGLFALKWVLDSMITWAYLGRVFNPLAYAVPLISVRAKLLGVTYAAPVPTAFHFLGAAAALPFLWVGLTMSVRRAANAGLSPWVGTLFLVPVVNFLAMLVLAVAPTSRAPTAWVSPQQVYRPAPEAGPKPALDSSVRATVRGVLGGIAVGLGMTALGVYGLRTYGLALFFLTPFALGAVTAALCNLRELRSLGHTLVTALLAVALTGLAILLFALEGVLCLAMALPIAAVVAVAGAAITWVILNFTRRGAGTVAACFFFGLPGFAGLEAKLTQPTLREVVTTVDIDAPPEVVWDHVVGFSELPPPPEWFFHLGVSYPQRARIQGTGVGAVRRCEFSTGPFVEPITRWEPPRRLSFNVVAQPPSMTELSPYRHVNAPHLEGYMLSRRGEFRLSPLPGGRTHLEGSTWYTLSLSPEPYWVVPAELLLHAIHGRVLRHVRALSEADGRNTAVARR
jgi:uncharacterized protein YndB with AHSA1/START domain